MAFTAKDVQALREKTGCGMMDCKKALTETDGDMEAAADYLREKGLASQAKKSTRIAAEGTVCAYAKDGVGVLVELNSETDFVANGDGFKALAAEVAEVVAEQNPADLDALLKCEKDGMTVEAKVQELFLAIRENIKIRRFVRIEGKVVTYVHAGGKIGVLVNFDTSLDNNDANFVAMGKNIAMQIAAMNPSYLDEASVPADVLAKEKEILIAQMKEDPKMANKPEAVLGKIVDGKIGNTPYKFMVMQVTGYKRWHLTQQVIMPPQPIDPWFYGGRGWPYGYGGWGWYNPGPARVQTVVTE